MQTTSFEQIAFLAEFCVKNGLSDVVISPGSRNAPLIIAFEAHPEIKTHLIHDERSAGFFALGLAEATNKPVALTCTSGSALLNYSPALVEAYYRQVPLIVFSADRPAHLIDHGDGQTMRQGNVYQNFIKYTDVYPEREQDLLKSAKTCMVKTFQEMLNHPMGPVHLNIPLDEPLYGTNDLNSFDVEEIIISKTAGIDALKPSEISEIENIWTDSVKKLLIVGQHEPDDQLALLVNRIADDPSIAVLVENTSNIQYFARVIHCIDRTLATIEERDLEKFAPDLLISIGGAVISKRIKAYFRKHKAVHTWRVGKYPVNEDTFQSLTKTLEIDPRSFLDHIISLNTIAKSNMGGWWKQKDLLAQERHQHFINESPYSDLTVFDLLLDTIPDNAYLHMGNSSVIRYCQLFDPVKGTKYFSNRGVSGIDGSSSTAAGFSVFKKNELNVLISGDISFFYDSNAFWNSELIDNLKVIVISNGGGGIFQIIPGPAESEQSNTFFAPTNASVKGICEAYSLNYYKAESLEDISKTVENFFSHEKNGRPSVLEVITQNQNNAEVLKAYFSHLAKD